jgi:tripartite-type tricarboxylate transporter receptor subunit TctC
MRSLCEEAGKLLGQPIITENRPGASGTLHAQALAQARPDGYTLGQMHLSVVRRPFLVKTPQWDTTTDFTHIMRVCGWLYGVAVKADAPWKSWAEFIAHARANPGRVTFATSGIATTNHLAMEELGTREGVQFTHVPFRGSSEGVTAVLSGTTDCIADSSAWMPQVEAGAMRCLCVWTEERIAKIANVPTLKELGHDMVVTSPYGVSGPKGMDPAIIRTLHDAFRTARHPPRPPRSGGPIVGTPRTSILERRWMTSRGHINPRHGTSSATPSIRPGRTLPSHTRQQGARTIPV